MNSDNARMVPDAPRPPAGPGFVSAFNCGKCHRPSAQYGSKVRMVLGLRTKVCGRCAK